VGSVVVAVWQLGGSSGSPGIKFIGLKSLPTFAGGVRRQSPRLLPSKARVISATLLLISRGNGVASQIFWGRG
jgi:hypothetical protein